VVENVKGLTSEQVEEIQTKLLKLARQRIGNAMIYELAEVWRLCLCTGLIC
jgi:hypothetical protein